MKIRPFSSIFLLMTKHHFPPSRDVLAFHGVRPHYSSTTTCLLAKKKKKASKRESVTSFIPPDDSDYIKDIQFLENNLQLNRRGRLAQILERDGAHCIWCRTSFELTRATTDHLIPKLKGGPSWMENEVAACRKCNKVRGHTMPSEWIQDCRSKGWEPNENVIVQCLVDLERAIQQRGGQRKARPHLVKQLKKLGSKKQG